MVFVNEAARLISQVFIVCSGQELEVKKKLKIVMNVKVTIHENEKGKIPKRRNQRIN